MTDRELLEENNKMLKEILSFVRKVDSAEYRDHQDFMEFLRNVAADIWVEYTEPEQRGRLFNLMNFRKIEDATEVVNLLVRSRAFKVGSKYLNRSYERLNVINEGVVPAVEGCVGYTNEEFERVNKENNDPESAKIGSFNKTVEEANNIRSRVLKYVDKIKQERAYNIDLCMTFERYIEIADKDAERAMAFLKEAYPFNEETEVFIRKRYNMSIDVNPEEN